MDVVYTLIIYGSLLFVAFILWCSCVSAGEFDKVTEEQWLEYLERNNDEDGLLQEMYKQE